MKIAFVADFFANQVLGGGELNNEELIQLLSDDGHDVVKRNSHLLTRKFIKEHSDAKFIVANFMNLSKECIGALYDKKYIIYEHDHKYLINRNPAEFKNFIAPKDKLVNIGFYKKAAAVICQSQFHKDIIKSNLGLDNLISIGGNLWSTESLDLMSNMTEAEKTDTYAVLDSEIEHKNTQETIMYCEYKNLDYKLVKSAMVFSKGLRIN